MIEGYIKTSYRAIPEDWEDLTLGDIVKFSGGAQPPRNTFVFELKEGYIRLIQTRDYKSDKYKTYIPQGLARKTCTKDDIMIGRYGPPIFQILKGLEGAYNVALIKAIPNEDKIFKKYLYYYITQYKVWAFVENLSQRSGGQTGVDLEKLREYPLPLPPKYEQQKIAEILSTVDVKMEVIAEQIKQTQTLKKGLMQRLFTKGFGHTKFKTSLLGEIPDSWEVTELGSHALLMTNGFVGTATPYYVDEDGITYLQGFNVQENRLRLKGIKSVSREFHMKQKKSHLKEGDLLTVQSGHIGTTAVVPKDFEGANCHALIITRLDKAHFYPKFIAYFINSPLGKEKINVISVGSTILHVNVKDFMKFVVPKPSLAEQQKIVELLSTVDSKLDILNDKKAQYQELKKGLMQQLLTGKLRVNHLIEQPEPA